MEYNVWEEEIVLNPAQMEVLKFIQEVNQQLKYE